MISLEQAKKYKAEIQKLLEKSKRLYAKADAENRSLTDEEEKQAEAILADIDLRKEAIKPYEQVQPRLVPPEPTEHDLALRASAPAEEWRCVKTGRVVPVLRRDNSMADFTRSRGKKPLSIGRAIVGLVTGKWANAEDEKRAMGEQPNWAGGYLVGEELSSNVIDKARALSVLMRAGAAIIPMETETLSMARVATDPTMAEKGENDAWTETTIALDAINFVATTYGGIIYASNELLQDAPNAASVIEQTLARAMAVKVDALGLDHILANASVEEEGTVGAIAWEDFITGMEKVELNNGVCTGYIVNPAVRKDLRSLTSGDGANSAKLWLEAPPDVAALQSLTTTGIALANGVIGDLTQMMLGLRLDARIETSNSNNNAFAKYQTAIRCVWRGAWNIAHANHICKLTGITS